MHAQIGNKWALIAQKMPGRSDNCIKNHFYSRLRKTLRRLNKLIVEYMLKQHEPIRTSAISRLTEASESKFKSSSRVDEELADFCNGSSALIQILFTASSFLATNQKKKWGNSRQSGAGNWCKIFTILKSVSKKDIKWQATKQRPRKRPTTSNHRLLICVDVTQTGRFPQNGVMTVAAHCFPPAVALLSAPRRKSLTLSAKALAQEVGKFLQFLMQPRNLNNRKC